MQYSSINIGDEIQTIAQMRFIPKVDEWVPRETINKFKPKSKKKTKLIMNAWWMWQPKNFPPSEYIEPLLVSMYIRNELHKTFLTKKTKEYLKKFGPVGCRDISTCNWLNKEGIPAYFSGCLTLTLQPNPKIKKEDYVLCVDVADDIVEEIKKRTTRPVYKMTKNITPYYNFERRLEIAKLVLRLYHNAACVVSPGLHAIMPALAFDTPVLRLIYKDDNTGRYTGYEDFFNTANIKEFMENKSIYDFDNPPKNPQKHIKLRDELIKKCTEFTGYDRNKSFLEEDLNPLAQMMYLSRSNYHLLHRLLYKAKLFDMFKVFWKRIILRTTFYDRKEKRLNIEQQR